MMKSFELQTYKDGQWKVDSFYDDQKLAVFEAKRVDESDRFANVRVIEEFYHEDSNVTTTRTVFRGHNAKRKYRARNVEASKKQKRTAPAGGTGRDPLPKRRAQPKAKSSNFLIPVLIILVILFGGLAAVFGLMMLSDRG